MKSVPSISFTVFLTGLTYQAFSAPYQNETQFNEFLKRLKPFINATSPIDLPLMLKVHAFHDLMWTSNDFKDICLGKEVKLLLEGDDNPPVTALNRTINEFFREYKTSAKEYSHIVEEIQSIDPIGLNVYLTKKNVENSSPTFMRYVVKFQATMNQRLRLLCMKINDSYIEIFEENHNRILHEVPEITRKPITREYAGIKDETISFFAAMAMEQFPNITMYPLDASGNIYHYNQHWSNNVSDVQIIFDEDASGHHDVSGAAIEGHTQCIFYKASTQMVHVYDSQTARIVTEREQKIIDILYPFSQGIIFERPKTTQNNSQPTCAIFSMAYATTLLLEKDPAETEFKLNKVHGDETLYMRIHLMNMFANRKFVLFK